MHRVWLGVDSGLPVRKQTRHDVVSCKMSILAFPRAKFLSRVHLDLAAARIFRPTLHEKIWPNFVQSYFVRTLACWTWLRSLVNAPCLAWSRFWPSSQKKKTASCSMRSSRVNPLVDSGKAPRACTVSGLESIRAFPSKSSHDIMRQHCDHRRNEVQGIPALAGACGCTLLWIRTELPVHAPCLDWSRLRRSRQEAHTVSYGILRKVEPDR